MEILRRTEKATIRVMCLVRLIEKKNSYGHMDLLNLKDTLDGLASAIEVQWHWHALRK